VAIKQRIGNEMSLLTNEVAERYSFVWSQKESKRFRFLAAQASLCMYFMKTTMAQDDDWGWFPDFLDEYREEALDRYQDAREEGDHDLALVMLAQLRLSTTLARRLADSRRKSLFIGESRGSDQIDEELMWMRELSAMLEESIANHQRVEPHGNQVRSTMALAQVYLATGFLKNAVESEDWSWIKDDVYDYIESETARYREARVAGDRDKASVMLARVRFSTTLARRLDNPERQAWLASISKGSDTKH